MDKYLCDCEKKKKKKKQKGRLNHKEFIAIVRKNIQF